MCTGLNCKRFEVFRPGKPYIVFEVHMVRYAPPSMKVEAVYYSETLKLPTLHCLISKKTTTTLDRIGWPTSLLPLHLTEYFESTLNCLGMYGTWLYTSN
jgi:hypothetical protein